MPVVRALIFAYPDEEELSDTWNEYLYGADLLVAPVTTTHADSRDVYLPAGRWMSYNDKRSVYGRPRSRLRPLWV
jgi:alpha-glucosidase (family GH31 glycosyl hydrolase)